MYFDRLLKQTNKKFSAGELCDLLAKANISVYHYENKKWWGRKSKTASSLQIDKWDEMSRTWVEKRALFKSLIDNYIKDILKNKKRIVRQNKTSVIYNVLPISLMIDMLTIENIKYYDNMMKGNIKSAKQSQIKIKELIKVIEDAFEDIIASGVYDVGIESRTF